MIDQYLSNLGLTEKEQKIYLALAELGVQPASVVARHCRLDRVTTYKHLKKLAGEGYVKIYFTHAIQHFGIEGTDCLERALKDKEETIQDMLRSFPIVAKQLTELGKGIQTLPQVQVFEGVNGIKSCFRDVLHELKAQGLKQVRMLSTNTFSERLESVPLSRFISEFLRSVKKDDIDMDILEATGTLIPERMEMHDSSGLNPARLPAAGGATHIFLAGTAVYLLTFKETQIGLKIKQQEMAQIFHFLFDLAGNKIMTRKLNAES